MTDHPKPIARYDVVRWPSDDGPADEVIEAEFGDYVLYAEHEAALAAAVRDAEERIVDRLSAMLTSDLKVIADIGFPQTAIRIQHDGEAKDARIAKLERERNFHAEQSNTAAKGRMRSELDLEALRTAIEAKALEWKEKAPAYSSPYEKEIWLECAADLLALLEKKP